MVRKRREVKEFKYPVEAKPLGALADIFSIRILKPMLVLWLFHISMALQLITGLIMDLGLWTGTVMLRQFHGYAGAFFTIMFAIYVGIIAINKDFRALREPINYVEMVFYAGLILFGLAVKFPNLLPFMAPITPFHCTLLTYGWIAVSVLGGGGIVQGLAAIYFLIARARRKTLARLKVPEEAKEE